MKLIKNKRGQGLIEYLIIVSIVAVGSMAVMRVVGSNLNRKFGSIAEALGGQTSKIQALQVDQSHYKKRDMSDFFRGAASGEKGSKSQNSSEE